MHFSLSLILTAMATTAVSAATLPMQASKVNTTELAVAHVFSLAEFTDGHCTQGQRDWTLIEGVCYAAESNSWSLDIWYMDPGCHGKKLPLDTPENP